MDQVQGKAQEVEGPNIPTSGRPEENGFLTRDQILGAKDLEEEVVDVPEWGGRVLVVAMTGSERDAFESSLVVNKGKKNQYTDTADIRAKLAAQVIRDHRTKKRIFTPADVVALGKKSAAALDRVFTVGMDLSKFSKEDLEELQGNSEPDRSDDS